MTRATLVLLLAALILLAAIAINLYDLASPSETATGAWEASETTGMPLDGSAGFPAFSVEVIRRPEWQVIVIGDDQRSHALDPVNAGLFCGEIPQHAIRRAPEGEERCSVCVWLVAPMMQLIAEEGRRLLRDDSQPL